MRALAEERCHAVVAGSAVVAGGAGAVVNVLAAVVARPPVHADAVVAAVRVMTGAAVLAGIGHQLALIHIFSAVLTWKASGRLQGATLCDGLCDFYSTLKLECIPVAKGSPV